MWCWGDVAAHGMRRKLGSAQAAGGAAAAVAAAGEDGQWKALLLR